MRPVSEQLGRGYGSPKPIDIFTNITKFRSIIDTTNTSYHEIGLYLSSLLKLLAICYYTLKYTFEILDQIKSIHQQNLKEDTSFCSFMLNLHPGMFPQTKQSISLQTEFIGESYQKSYYFNRRFFHILWKLEFQNSIEDMSMICSYQLRRIKQTKRCLIDSTKNNILLATNLKTKI